MVALSAALLSLSAAILRGCFALVDQSPWRVRSWKIYEDQLPAIAKIKSCGHYGEADGLGEFGKNMSIVQEIAFHNRDAG